MTFPTNTELENAKRRLDQIESGELHMLILKEPIRSYYNRYGDWVQQGSVTRIWLYISRLHYGKMTEHAAIEGFISDIEDCDLPPEALFFFFLNDIQDII